MIIRHLSESQWKKFTSSEGAFTILMPGEPKVENETRVIIGMQMEIHQFSPSSQTGGELSVGYVDAPVLPPVAVGERSIKDYVRDPANQDVFLKVIDDHLAWASTSLRSVAIQTQYPTAFRKYL